MHSAVLVTSIIMPWKTEDKSSASDTSLFPTNGDPVVSPLSISSSLSGTRLGHVDIELGHPTDGHSIGRKSVSFEEVSPTKQEASSDPNVSLSMLAAATAGGAAASVAVTNREGDQMKPKSTSPSIGSPSSVKTSPTMASEDSYDPPRSQGPTVVTIEHTVRQKKGEKLLKMLLKPSVLAAGAVIFLLTGGAAFFFTRWLSIPGLNEQIERLQAEVAGLEIQVDELEIQVDRLGEEVDRLGSEVDRLAKENDRFARLNEDLETNVAAYEVENNRLNASLAEYKDLNSQLDSTVKQLLLITGLLEDQNSDLNATTLQLNTTTSQLGIQIDRLETVAANLTSSNRELKELNEGLLNQTMRLKTITEDLNETVTTLGGQVDILSVENKRLASLNADLTLVVTFLNDTAVGIQASYANITKFLAEQITAYRVLALETLQNLYMQRVSRWDCDFQSYFMTKPFATNRTLLIGQADYPDALEYVDERVLSELCLDLSDFERYLEDEYGPSARVTTNQLFNSISSYTTNALAYYFPSGDKSGLTNLDWSEAGFSCENLPADQQYSHSS